MSLLRVGSWGDKGFCEIRGEQDKRERGRRHRPQRGGSGLLRPGDPLLSPCPLQARQLSSERQRGSPQVTGPLRAWLVQRSRDRRF